MAYELDNYLSSGTSGQVPRTELIRKIKTKCAGKHIYITAASGYGKTVAASQWLATVRGNKAKIILDNTDNIPGVFYKRLATALLKLTGKVSLVPDAAISFDRLLETIKLLPAKNKRCYFLVDDIHVVKNEEIINRMPVFFKRIPGYVRCCMINRSEPTPALLKTGLFEVITGNDLAFSNEEIEWLGVERGIELTPGQVDELQKKTGGWVMYLLALLSGGSIPGDIAIAKTPSALTQYIESRIWEHNDRETKKLLLTLAVPAEINPELCERLTLREGGNRLLRRIAGEENTFLALTGKGKNTYRFHDIYREFLLKRIKLYLPEDEVRRLNDVVGRWYYEQGEYYEGARYFISNRDHDGITRCLSETLRYLKETSHISVEVRLGYAKQYLKDLPPDFILENAYLIIWRVSTAFHDGDTEAFCKYMDALYERFPHIASEHPNLLQTVMFVYSLDYRFSAIEQCTKIAKLVLQQAKPPTAQQAVTRISSITQNLPFFHRSMRDHSELHELRASDLKLFADTYGIAIGNDYKSMEPSVIAGIYYERGEMLEAIRYALNGYSACTDDMHPETRFCAYMILSAIFHAIGAQQEADTIMNQMRDYIENEARFLMMNLKAITTVWAVQGGDKSAAREWLDVNAYRSPGRLPFYQMCHHFATLYSLTAVDDNTGAIEFGRRLQTLVDDYRRPIDQIEIRVIIALAMRRNGNSLGSMRLFKEAAEIAMPYGFTQAFVIAGREVLPMLRELRRAVDTPKDLAQFASKVFDAACKRFMVKPEKIAAPMLSKRQRTMLSHLDSGLTYAEIAEKTGIPRATVKYHLLTAYKKIGVHDGAEAIMRAKELGLL